MKRRMSSSALARIAGASVVGAVVAVTTLVGAGVASAAPVDKTIAYDCDIPIFGTKTLNIEVQADIPATATVGSPIQLHDVAVVVPIPHDLYDTFTPFGATQADATLDFGFVIGGVSVPVDWYGPPTQIPNPSGPDLLLVFHGSVPSVTPGQAGIVTVAAGRDLTIHLTPRDAAGNPTVLGTLAVPGTTTADTTLGTVVVA